MNITAKEYYDNNLENYNLLNKIDPATAKQAMQIMGEYHQAKLKLLGIGGVVKSLPDGDDVWCKASEMSRDNFADWYDNL